MLTRKHLAQAALTLAVGALLSWPGPGRTMDISDAPESIEIDSLSELYGPVAFDHLMHTDMVRCAECHHHTTGTGPASPFCGRCHEGTEEAETVACTDCHPAKRFYAEYLKTLENPELYHIDKPGLKGAYHLNCRGCHAKVGGPTGCQDCHEITKAGEKRFDTGTFAPPAAGRHRPADH
ncbi:MAG TPA: class III cytochrome C [Desulfobulbus sp.]|nr:class III cytochrome C [Desulfobulbus sp.]